MTAVTIRKAVSPDIELFTKFDHTIKTDHVWQMTQTQNLEKIQISFSEIKLPRELKLSYPRSPEALLQNWKNHSVILTACAEGKPIAYLTINTVNSREIIWVKDLVVEDYWRRQGVATTLFHAANQWGISRKFHSAMIEMASKNYPAICLVRKLGFEFTGFNDHYLENNDIALFFSRYLI